MSAEHILQAAEFNCLSLFDIFQQDMTYKYMTYTQSINGIDDKLIWPAQGLQCKVDLNYEISIRS